MNHNTPLESVAEFHELFDHPILPHPQIPDATRCALRIALLTEELKELQEGINNGSIVEIADAFADLQYVLSGAILEFGLGDDFPAIFNEVHRSNMSKACATIEEAEATVKYYLDNELHNGVAVTSHIVPRGGVFFVYRDVDKKTLKNVNYSPANIHSVLVRNKMFLPTTSGSAVNDHHINGGSQVG